MQKRKLNITSHCNLFVDEHNHPQLHFMHQYTNLYLKSANKDTVRDIWRRWVDIEYPLFIFNFNAILTPVVYTLHYLL